VELDEQGRYTVLLGATSRDGLPLELFPSGKSRWLGVQVESREEEPRVLLVSVPYALKAADAETLGGRPASAFALATESSATAEKGAVAVVAASVGKEASEAPALTQPRTSPAVTSGTANYLAKFINTTDLGNSVVYESPGGNLGIGTTGPLSSLDVRGAISTYDYPILAVNGIGGIGMWKDSTPTNAWAIGHAVPGSSLTNDLIFSRWGSAAWAEKLRITNDGKVGIRTTGPLSSLDVRGAISTYDYPILAVNGMGGIGMWKDSTPTNAWAIGHAVPGGSLTDDLIFSRWTSGAWAEKLRLTNDGNVGIGTAAPAAKLEVNGTAKFNDLVTFAAGQNFSTTSGTVTAATGAFTGSTSDQVLNVTQSGSGAAAVLNNTTGGPILTGQNNGSEVFSVDGSGNLSVVSGNISLPQTTSASTGVINLGGNRFLHACCSADQFNTFVGGNAGNLTGTGVANTASGWSALSYNTTGVANTAIGQAALMMNTMGSYNTATGSNALQSGGGGSHNTASGYYALSSTTGVNNTGTGTWALGSNTTASNNTAVGAYALDRNCSGVPGACPAEYNTALGAWAGEGYGPTFENANTTGAFNTFIGASTGPATSTQVNKSTAIGYNARVAASNALVLGGTGDDAVNVGIGTQSPAHTLDVVGTGNFSGAVTAASFTGDGSGLTNVTTGTANDLSCSGCISPPEVDFNYAGSTTKGGPATSALAADSAAVATNAVNLGGVSGSTYARLDTSNSFNGSQVMTGNMPDPVLQVTQSGSGMGIVGTTTSTLQGASGLHGAALASEGAVWGVRGTTESSGDGASGVRGDAGASGGNTHGVVGLSMSPTGSGVTGGALATTGSATGVAGWTDALQGVGVVALARETSTEGRGLAATAEAPTGPTIGVKATVISPDGTAGVFENWGQGTILLALAGQPPIEVFRVEGSGNVVSTSGDFQALGAGKGIILKSPDGNTCARISLSNEGALVTTVVTCP